MPPEEIRRHGSPAYEDASAVGGSVFEPRLVASLVHDLRNQLAPIAHTAEALALSPEAAEPVRRSAALIQRQGRRVSRLLDGMAFAARIFEPGFVLDCEPLALAPVLDEVARQLAGLGAPGFDLVTPATTCQVHASREHLAWVLLELLDAFTTERRSGQVARLAVAEQGQSIVLAVGELAPASVTTRTAGTLGLACVQRLLHLMHGEALFELAPGAAQRGFCVTLRGASSATQEVVARSAPPALRRVLVVDDNRALRESLCALIAELGHEGRAAATGFDALTLALLWEPDLVLIDVNLGGANGYDVALRLRSEFARDAMQILMMSGYASGEALGRETRRRGLDGFIAKMDCGEVLRRLLPRAES